MAEGKTYFHRLGMITENKFWVNNPTIEEAGKAIEAGAIACTTNPTFAYKQSLREDMTAAVMDAVQAALMEAGNDTAQAADLVQAKLVGKLAETFYPLWEKNPGKEGFVSIQGNPHNDQDADIIIEESLRYRKISDNIIAKIPVIPTGIAAITELVKHDVPILATEVMSIAQALEINRAYNEASDASGKRPPFYITHITGIFDQYLQEHVKEQEIDISPDILWAAGTLVARKQYNLLKENDFRGIMIGGGARGLHHFTEFVGSDMHVTINWKGTADKLIDLDPPVVFRMETPPADFMVEELLRKLPDFAAAWNEEGLPPEKFASYGPVQLFRNMFVDGWDKLEQLVEETGKKAGRR